MLSKVLAYFEELSKIPHGSGNTYEISQYCVNFAMSHGYDYYTDDTNNVIIYAPATKGLEDRETILLQGHLDMVCEAAPNVNFDFNKDPLKLYRDGDFLKAEGTTLGGDDGIAVAIALAILDSDVPHPALEVLFTTDEETGMYGAIAIDAERISSRTLINIDSEEEGVITAGCAGGACAEIVVPVTPVCVDDDDEDEDCYRVKVCGLIGGHSGSDINKGRLNSNVVMGEYLAFLESNDISIRLISLDGGDKDNVIPNMTEAVIFAFPDITDLTKSFIETYEFGADKNLDIVVEKIKCQKAPFMMLGKTDTERINDVLSSVPNGVQSMSSEIKGLVQTSLNFASVHFDSRTLKLRFLVRSSVEEEKEQLLDRLTTIATDLGGSIFFDSEYAAWEYAKESKLRDKMIEVYKRQNGKEPRVEVIHAGLECGILAGKLSGLDAVSIGPDILDIHSPSERLSISSTERVIKLILGVLEEY